MTHHILICWIKSNFWQFWL